MPPPKGKLTALSGNFAATPKGKVDLSGFEFVDEAAGDIQDVVDFLLVHQTVQVYSYVTMCRKE